MNKAFLICIAAIPLLFSAGCESFTSSQDVQRSTQNPPATPQNLQTTVAPARIVLTWDINPNTNFFRVYWTDDGSDPTSTSNVVDSVDATLYDHKNLDWLKNYRYRVSAVNKIGASQLSASVMAKPLSVPLTIPSSLTASLGTRVGGIFLDWNANPESGVTYAVSRKDDYYLAPFIQIADSLASSSYLDNNVREGAGYFYIVKAERPSTAQESPYCAKQYGYTWKTVAESEPNNPPSSGYTGLWSSFGNDLTGLDNIHLSGSYSDSSAIFDTTISALEDIDYFKISLNAEESITFNLVEGSVDSIRGMSVSIGQVLNELGVLRDVDGGNLKASDSFKFHLSSTMVYAYIKITIPSHKGVSYTYKVDFQFRHKDSQ